jgi:hypothetical protein
MAFAQLVREITCSLFVPFVLLSQWESVTLWDERHYIEKIELLCFALKIVRISGNIH